MVRHTGEGYLLAGSGELPTCRNGLDNRTAGPAMAPRGGQARSYSVGIAGLVNSKHVHPLGLGHHICRHIWFVWPFLA